MIKISRNKKSGFTLVEAVIGGAIIVTGLVGALAASTVLTQSSNLAFERTIALQDAQLIMEALRTWQLANPDQSLTTPTHAAPVGGVPASDGTWPSWLASVKAGLVANPQPPFTSGVRMLADENPVVTVTNLDISPRLQRVVVVITWTGRGGNPGIRLDSFFIPRPLNS